MSNTTKTVLAILFVFIIAFSAIVITDEAGRFWRADLTEYKLYTLSEGTREVIGALNSPVSLKLYYARTAALKGPDFLRKYNTYYLYIRDLLREYERLSEGKVKLEFIDPRPDTDDEMDAVRYGLQRYPVGDESFYFGLAITTEFGQEKALPFFSPLRQEVVEYEISSAIYSVSTRVKKKIGVLSSLDITGVETSDYMRKMMKMQGKVPPEAWHFVKQLRSLYEVVPVNKDSDSITPVDLLLVVHPKMLPGKTLFAIDQYVMKGGKVMFFVDPYCVVDTTNMYARSSHVNDLLKAWGCEMVEGSFVGDRDMALTIQLTEGGKGTPFISFLGVKGENINRNDVTSAKLEEIRLLFAGALKEVPKENIKAEAILMTTAKGNVMDTEPIARAMGQGPDPNALLKEYKEGSEPIALGYKLTGKFESAFPKGFKEVNDEGELVKVHEGLVAAEEESSIIVFADVDMVNNFVAFTESIFGVTPSVDNVSLVLNSIENLTGARALMSARSKGKFRRPFKILESIEAEAEEKTSEQVEQVEGEISKYEGELRELEGKVNDENAALIEHEALIKKRELENELMKAKHTLRELNREKRERIESVITRLKIYNMAAAPSIILLLAAGLAVLRANRRKKYREMRYDK